jgi:sulfite reductase alpha subunit-like flavoprotein
MMLAERQYLSKSCAYISTVCVQSLHASAKARGIDSRVSVANDAARMDFLGSPVVVIVCSTTGNGDPPDNAAELVFDVNPSQ